MTDAEIKKALECCSDYGLLKCLKCPKRGTSKTCMYDLSKEALDLINRQQAEIERLQKFKAYFDSLYGEGLEIANWHKNEDLEPFDNFYDSAIKEMVGDAE